MVMAHSLFQILTEQNITRQLDILAPQWNVQLASRMPEIRDAITMPLGHGELQLRTRYRLGKKLRSKRYQQAILLPNTFKSALIPYWAKIPHRTGWVGESRQLLLTDCRKPDPAKPAMQVHQYAALGYPKESILSDVAPPQLTTTEDQFHAALRKHSLDVSKPILVLCPGAEFGPAKQWPARHFAAIANAQLAEGWQVWVLGSAKDKMVAEELNSLTSNRCRNLAGDTSLTDVCDLISRADLVISNDSGLMHIAASYNRKLISLFGSSSHELTPPLNPQSKVLSLSLDCSPCYQRSCPKGHTRCLVDLKPHMVLDAMGSML